MPFIPMMKVKLYFLICFVKTIHADLLVKDPVCSHAQYVGTYILIGSHLCMSIVQ